jgi:predicted MFS family arabinose efflux permease
VTALRVLPTLADHIQKSNPTEIVKRYIKIGTNGKYVRAYGLIFMAAMTIFILIPFLAPFAVKNIGIKTYEIKYMYFFAGAATVVTSRLFGVLTDRLGPLTMYTILGTVSIVPIYIYTNAEPMSVISYILMGMLFMTIVSGRMVPCMTLVSAVPDQNDRGTFMGLLNSVRALGSATATMVGGLIITEENNRLLHFNKVGLLSIFLIFISIFVARSIRIDKVPFSESETVNF